MSWFEDWFGNSRKIIGRRRFIKAGLVVVASFSPHQILKALQTFPDSKHLEKSLSFYNIHTNESLSTTYRAEGKLFSQALDEINYILRDHRTGEVKAIDIQLLDLLFAISMKLKTHKPFHVISGYRSPQTNAYLCERSRGVARKSLHLKGKAADIRLPDCRLSKLRRVALELRGGGVGYYPRSDFIHVDVGRVRYW